MVGCGEVIVDGDSNLQIVGWHSLVIPTITEYSSAGEGHRSRWWLLWEGDLHVACFLMYNVVSWACVVYWLHARQFGTAPCKFRPYKMRICFT
jgi:hypothetical protein